MAFFTSLSSSLARVVCWLVSSRLEVEGGESFDIFTVSLYRISINNSGDT